MHILFVCTGNICRSPTGERLAAAYDQWWTDCQPLLVNEKVVGPKLNPFAELYWKQFGGGPTEADYKRMDPTKAWSAPAGEAKKKANKN